MTPRAITDGPADGPYWRLFEEGSVVDHDGFTVPSPAPPEALDLNRNFPAGWATNIPGAGDFPGSEPEVDALIEQGRSEIDEAKRIAIYRQMQEKVVADAPDIFGVLERRKLGMSDKVKGFQFVPVASNAIECFGLSI